MTTPWQEEIVRSFVTTVSVTDQFTDSFDDFVDNRIGEIIKLLKPVRASDKDRWVEIKISGGT